MADKAAQDPNQLADQALEAAVRAARAGKKRFARQLLLKVTELDPTREDAWLWLASVAAGSEEALGYLRTVLALNPVNRQAQEGLEWIRRRHPAAVDPAPVADLAPSGEPVPNFVLSVAQAEAIDICLAKMAYESEARCIILADVTGQRIAERGQTRAVNTQVLSALAAGELAATHELARLVGERARFKLLLHEGESQSVYLSDVGEQLIVVIVFDNDTPIGLVRMVLKQAVEELAPILAEAGAAPAGAAADETLGSDFAQLLENELDASLEL